MNAVIQPARSQPWRGGLADDPRQPQNGEDYNRRRKQLRDPNGEVSQVAAEKLPAEAAGQDVCAIVIVTTREGVAIGGIIVRAQAQGEGQAAEGKRAPGAPASTQRDRQRREQHHAGRPHQHGDRERNAGHRGPTRPFATAQRAQNCGHAPRRGDAVAAGRPQRGTSGARDPIAGRGRRARCRQRGR